MKNSKLSYLILPALFLTVQMTLAGCNKTEQVSLPPKDTTTTVVTAPPVQTTTTTTTDGQGQTPADEKNKAVTQKVTTKTSKERDIRNKKIGDDRHMRDTTTIHHDPTKPLTIQEKNDQLKQSEIEAKKQELERRRRLKQGQ